MKSKLFALNDDVVTSYDQTKTTIVDSVTQKTINSQLVLGPPLNEYLDVITDTTPFGVIAPSGQFTCSPYTTSNVTRIFILGAEAGGLTQLLLYNFNIVTGASSYVGKINFQTADVAATTTTFRAIKVDDVGTTNWKIFIGTTGSVLINGGLYLINNVGLSDFTASGTTISFATTSNQKAVYFLQDPSGVGVGHIMTAMAGTLLDRPNKKAYVQNGVSATYQFWVFDYNSNPTYSTNSVTGVAATDVISDAGHTYVDNDPIVFTAITGGAGITVGTTYFVRSSVAGVSYQISTTSGGAALNFTTDISAGTVGRAFGTSTNLFSLKTGNLPALTGTLLLNNSLYIANPGHSANAGFDCAAFATSSNLYLGKLSELTSGAVTWPSLISANLLGDTNEVTAPTAAIMSWGETTDHFYFNTNTTQMYGKRLVNNQIDLKLGFLNTEYYEGTSTDVHEFGAVTVNGMENRHGWIFFLSTTTGQRGVFAHYVAGNSYFDTAYVVSKVLDVDARLYKLLGTIEELFDFTSPMVFYYRTSGFGSISGGWTQINVASDISSIAVGDQIQIKIAFNRPYDAGTNPSQVHDISIDFLGTNENSEKWEFNYDDSDSGNPSRVSFRLKEVYDTSVPTLYFRAYDLSDVLVANHNTSANAGFFQYSTDSGANWNNLGTIPNTVGTLIRYTFSTPPGVEVRPSISEE
jgi:hypothetical protein